MSNRLQTCKAWKQGLPMPEIVFYTEENFGGESLRTNCDVNFVGTIFNDKIKSVVVVSGEWQLYKHALDGKSHTIEIGKVLEIGFHENIELGVSAARCIRC
jgi:hypothetical protein